MDELTIVENTPAEKDKVFFGAWVTLEDEDGKENRYRIVGPDEFNVSEGKLSMDSPLAKAMLGKRLDDEVILNKPEGQEFFYIVNIEYE